MLYRHLYGNRQYGSWEADGEQVVEIVGALADQRRWIWRARPAVITVVKSESGPTAERDLEPA
jgi:hypothetical protein